MKTLVNKEVNYSLHNNENFNKNLDPEISDIVKKLSELFIDYFKFIIENIKLKKTNFSRFIITRGLDTIINVFNHILFYTKNLDVTYFHCQKAFYFYVEFVGQISEDEKIFLQLSSRDASTYVYKKTIFEINNETRKNNEDISDYIRLKLDIINSYVDLYKTLLLKLINNDFLNNEKLQIIENIYNKLNNLNNKSNINLLNEVIEKLYYHIDYDKYFFNSCELIVKKFCKNQELTYDKCLNKFLSGDFNDKLHESSDKFVNWLMN
jgi:hypothetical protein